MVKYLKCSSCNKGFQTNKEVIFDTCLRCRNPKPECARCGKRFYTTKGADKCRNCRRLAGEISSAGIRKRIAGILKTSCDDVKNWKSDITCLNVKLKHNLLAPTDYFRVAHIYMAVTCNEVKFSALEPEEQVIHMLDELWQLLMSDNVVPKPHLNRKRRGVNLYDELGKVIETWSSISQCAEDLDLSRSQVRYICEHKSSPHFKLGWR